MPAAGAGAGAAAVPSGETEADPAAVAAEVPVGGSVTACWAGGAAGPAGGVASVPAASFSPLSPLIH